MANELYDLWVKNRRVYGRRKLWHAAKRAGMSIGRDQVERFMHVVGITGIRRGKRRIVTTVADPQATRHPDHVKRQWDAPKKPDELWVADFTYVWTPGGFCYVSFLTDVYSRHILGWRVSPSKETPLVQAALEHAVATRKRHHLTFTTKGILHHSDAGSQYTSLAFTTDLTEAKITGSIGSVGDALDNALMESTIGLYKTELIDHPDHPTWDTWHTVEKETASWIHWYNTERLHSSLGHTPPTEYENAYYAKTHKHHDPVAA
jgi:putative transposase